MSLKYTANFAWYLSKLELAQDTLGKLELQAKKKKKEGQRDILNLKQKDRYLSVCLNLCMSQCMSFVFFW